MESLPLERAQVIDIGCGEGWLTQLVAPKTRKTIGIDPSITALKRAIATKISANELYLLASAKNLPLDSGWADVAIYFNSLHHVPASLQHGALEETARVLADGGLLFIVEPLASGSAYELFRLIDDESAVYDATYRLILGVENGGQFQQEREELFINDYTYRYFEQFYDYVLTVDASREEALNRLEDKLRERFNRLGEAGEGGLRYDQIHRLFVLRKL